MPLASKTNRFKSYAISIRGKTKLSPVQSAFEAKPKKVMCDQHPRRTKPNQKEKKSKSKSKSKSKIKKKKTKKKGLFSSNPGQNVCLLFLPYS